MKVLIILLAFVSSAYAADYNITFKYIENASVYKLYSSYDNGASWDAGVEIPQPETVSQACPLVNYKVTDLPNSGLVLFKIKAIDAQGYSLHYNGKNWYLNYP